MQIYYSGFNISFSSSEEESLMRRILSPAKIGILVSYYNLSIPDVSYCDKIFCDSGAFSAWKRGIEIDISNYISFLKKEKDKFCVCASLDVIGDPVKSYENYKVMRNANLDVLPVFHFGEPFSYLEKYAKESNYIGLGGAAGIFKKSSRVSWFDKIFKMFPDRNKIGFHGFGIMDVDLIKRYPWRSIDATSACVRSRCGHISTKYGLFGISDTIDFKFSKWRENTEALNILKKETEDIGIDFEKLKQGNQEGCFFRMLHNIAYFEKIAKQSPEKFIEKGKQMYFNIGDFNEK
jgi:hypothetical protein